MAGCSKSAPGNCTFELTAGSEHQEQAEINTSTEPAPIEGLEEVLHGHGDVLWRSSWNFMLVHKRAWGFGGWKM